MDRDYLDETLRLTAKDWGTAHILDYSGVDLDPQPGKPTIEVTAEKVQDAPLRFQGQRVTVLNFASGVNPGGGVRHGAVAQEEDLCRATGLLHGLESLPGFYAKNQTAASGSYDMMIVSENVPLIRNGAGRLVPPVPIQVVTYPAPNIYLESQPGTLAEIAAIFRRRCAHVLHQARMLGTEVLVLGPWGCGAYGNDPLVVAQAFKGAIDRHSGNIKHILFACYGSKDNRDTFRNVLLGEVREQG